MRRIGDDKKAQQLTLGTIILIVLGVAVLVFLIYGFSTGWGNLWSRITAFGGGEENVDTMRQACVLACNTQSKYDYCNKTRTLVVDSTNRSRDVVGPCGNSNLTQYVGSCSAITC
jgi:hypothetical protein